MQQTERRILDSFHRNLADSQARGQQALIFAATTPVRDLHYCHVGTPAGVMQLVRRGLLHAGVTPETTERATNDVARLLQSGTIPWVEVAAGGGIQILPVSYRRGMYVIG
jgi:hypothetical protein